MIRAVLFDLDGTLADTAPDLAGALNEQRARHGLPALPLAEIRPYASHGTKGLLKVGFDFEPSHPDFEAYRQEYLALYEDRHHRETRSFPGMTEVLDALEQNGIRWGIVTNKPARFTLPLMAALGLDRRAACIISGDTCANCKPHPEPMLRASDDIGVSPTECLYVGDAERDVESAVAAGMRVVVALYGYLSPEDHPEQWGADGTIAHPADILALLDGARQPGV